MHYKFKNFNIKHKSIRFNLLTHEHWQPMSLQHELITIVQQIIRYTNANKDQKVYLEWKVELPLRQIQLRDLTNTNTTTYIIDRYRILQYEFHSSSSSFFFTWLKTRCDAYLLLFVIFQINLNNFHFFSFYHQMSRCQFLQTLIVEWFNDWILLLLLNIIVTWGPRRQARSIKQFNPSYQIVLDIDTR